MSVIKVQNISKKYFLGQSVSLKNTILVVWSLIKKIFLAKTDAGNPIEEEFWALNNVSFELNKGEILGIIGTNGSGKSTLLKILSRVTSPTKGEALIKGRVSSLLEVGTGFNPELTGRENIYLNGSLLGLTHAQIDSKFDEIVRFAGVEKFIDTPIKRYSSGMTVRLGFSVAAHLEAEILIVDEVLAVGDADFQRKSFARLNEIRSSGRSILFVSHSMELVANLCQRVLWLHLGEVKQIGTPQEVIQNYIKYHEEQRGSVTREKSLIGNGTNPFVSTLTMENRDGVVVESVSVGDSVKFVGSIKGLDENIESSLSFCLWIENKNQMVVAEINSDWKIEKIRSRGITEFTIELPKILFVPGLYSVSMELKVNYQLVDQALQICNFFVIASDYYQSGILSQSKGQTFLDFDIKAYPQKVNEI